MSTEAELAELADDDLACLLRDSTFTRTQLVMEQERRQFLSRQAFCIKGLEQMESLSMPERREIAEQAARLAGCFYLLMKDEDRSAAE